MLYVCIWLRISVHVYLLGRWIRLTKYQTVEVLQVEITGDMNDTAFAQRVQANAMTLTVHCSRVAVAASPAEQTRTIEVPAMGCLPD